MSFHTATVPVSNATMLCVGGITRSEAENARDDGHDVDGGGYYLFLADESAPKQPIRILAKFFSPSEAEAFAKAIGGYLND